MDGDRVTAENLSRTPSRPLRSLLFYHHLVPTRGGEKEGTEGKEEGREVRWGRRREGRGEREKEGREGEAGERGKMEGREVKWGTRKGAGIWGRRRGERIWGGGEGGRENMGRRRRRGDRIWGRE